ncbi:DUF4404 family protein [Bermanella sp. WJH001]|uniref:DUF4404 family protein n=1 Tax=Bermanella sp. WJH001 TaxID=3048005 RepID=UPI0024BEA565|nr:DUF4404 family protein [Bermanella sp. WJH001]MDJ1538339.1 DUF4404 family protein [Bermanella sp. WJH001]
MHDELKSKLTQLKQAIGNIDTLDDESRALLQQLDQDIKTVLTGEPADVSLNDRLEQQAVEFDSEHPKTSAVIRDIMDMLARMGI